METFLFSLKKMVYSKEVNAFASVCLLSSVTEAELLTSVVRTAHSLVFFNFITPTVKLNLEFDSLID